MSMNELLRALWDALSGVLGATAPVWVPTIAVAVLVTAAGYYLIPATARAIDRHRRGISKELHDELTALLSNREVIKVYAPAGEFISDVAEGAKRPRIHAWISPYARAVKATVKRQGRTPRNQYFNARAQVRHAAERVIVRDLSEDERATIYQPDETADQPFAIELQYDGKNPTDIERLFPAIKTQLGLRILEPTPDTNPFAVTLIASRAPLTDPLETMRAGVEFFSDHPATRPQQLPMAFTRDGKPWSLNTHHTLVFGVTGAGKSGPLLATIFQMAPFVKNGSVHLYGIDPKNSDIGYFAGTDLFRDVARTTEDAITIINEVHALMTQRTELGMRTVRPTQHTPWTLLIIDEVFTLYNNLQMTKAGKVAWVNLTSILAMGRSVGFYAIMATQFAKEENLKGIRDNLVNKIVLRQESLYLNDYILGTDAAADGYDSTAIRPSTEGNGYATAGIGYVKTETGEPVKVRFAYISEDDLEKFRDQHTPDTTEIINVHASALEDLPPLEPLDD